MMHRVLFQALTWVAMTLLIFAAETGSDLSPAEKRGKQIYSMGVSPNGGQVTALMGEAGIEVPASVLPCLNCHGPEGRGRPEGGVTPTDIRWLTLTKPYQVRLESGREHPPYTLDHLKRAISMGFDSAGNQLHLAMPRYRMSLEDMRDLLAYCQRLGVERDPGVSEDTVRIGTLLPPEGRMDGAGDTIESVLSALFSDWNSRGGIHGRALQLLTLRLPADPAEARRRIERFVSEERVFALCGAFAAGLEDEIGEIARAQEIPVVGPFSFHPRLGFPLNREVFYLFPGLATQGRAMVEFLSSQLGDERSGVAVVYPRGATSEEAAEAVREQAQKRGWKELSTYAYPPLGFEAESLARSLHRDGAEALFFLDTGKRAAELLAAAERLGWHPRILLSASLAGSEIWEAPVSFQDRIFLSLPTLPRDQTRPKAEAFQALAARRKLPSGHRALQLSTRASAEILAEGLKRAGRELSRERFTQALEGLHEFDTGLTPLITFGPNRRVGARGAYLAVVDLRNKTINPASQWIDVRP